MYYFPQKKVAGPPPRWPRSSRFSIAGFVDNRADPSATAFAHYGTSFGKVGMDLFYINEPSERLQPADQRESQKTSKLYYFDQTSSTMKSSPPPHQPDCLARTRSFWMIAIAASFPTTVS